MFINNLFRHIFLLFFLAAASVASEFSTPTDNKPLFIFLHGLGGNSAVGESIFNDFTTQAPQHLGCLDYVAGVDFDTYSPNAPNGQWFNPDFALSVMPHMDDAIQYAFLNSLTIERNARIHIDALANPDASAQITAVDVCLNELTAEIERVIDGRPLSKVALMGQSLGGIAACLIANKLSVKYPTQGIGSLIVDSAPIVWLSTSTNMPKYVVFNTPTQDEFFRNWFDKTSERFFSHTASRIYQSNKTRYSDSTSHCEMSIAYKMKAAESLLAIITAT